MLHYSQPLAALLLCLSLLDPTGLLAARPAHAASPNLVWKPYLQQVTPTSAIILWTTRSGTHSFVRYGPDTSYSATADGTTRLLTALNTQLHRVVLTNLQPNTTYAYKILTDDEDLLPDETLMFRTAPPMGSSEPLTFLAFGDFGKNTVSQAALRDQMQRDSFQFILTTGDNAYDNGTYAEFDTNAFQIYKTIFSRASLFPAIGNHETYTSNAAPYLDLFDLPVNSLRPGDAERYYSFDYGNLHIVVLDSNALLSADDTLAMNDMFDWLRADLFQTMQPWKIAVLHHSAYSTGKSHGSDPRVQSKLVPIFEQYGVQLVLGGHDHIYQRTKPLRGGQLTSMDQGGITYIVSGAGSAASYGCSDAAWIAVKICSQSYGIYNRITVNGDTMLVEAVRETGARVDSFTFSRILAPPPTPTNTATQTSTPSNTPTATQTSTPTDTAIATSASTSAPTNTATATRTPTNVPTNTATQTSTPTNTAIATSAPTNTASATSTPSATPGTTTLTFGAAADARVEEANPSTNYGTSSSLRVDGGSDPDIESFLCFTPSGVTQPIQSAKLKLYVLSDGSSNGPAIYQTSAGWSETSITWKTRPARASAVADDKGAFGTNTWIEYNVTGLVSSSGSACFVLATTSSDGAAFSSHQGINPPQLVLTLGSAPSPSVAPSSTLAPSPSQTPTRTPTPISTSTPIGTPTPTSTPVSNRIALPGQIEAEDYRPGGEGVGYHDSTVGNTGGVYRSDDVDIQTCTDGTGCYNVGWVISGEWLTYDVTVGATGTYSFTARLASPYTGKRFRIEVDGVNVSGWLAVPNTGSYKTWTTLTTSPITLSAGPHTIRIYSDTGSFNLNYITVRTA